MEDYLNTTNKDDYKNLKTSTNLKFASRNFIPIPTFLLQVVSDTIIKTDGDSKEVLLAVIKGIKDFDDEVTKNGTNTKHAKDSCGDMLHWIFLASKNKVKSTPTVGCSVWKYAHVSRTSKEPSKIQLKFKLRNHLTQNQICRLASKDHWR